MKFFNHETTAQDNRKLRKVIRVHGMQGYGIYWMLLETLYQSDSNGFQVDADDLWLEDMAEKMHLSDDRTLIRIIDTFAEIGLVSKQLWAEHVLFSDSIAERGDVYTQKKLSEKEKKQRQRASKLPNTSKTGDCPDSVSRDNLGQRDKTPLSPSHISNTYPNSDPNSYSDPNSNTNQDQENIINTPLTPQGEFVAVEVPFSDWLPENPENPEQVETPPTSQDFQETPSLAKSSGVETISPAAAKKSKPSDADFEIFREVWNQERPSHWAECQALNKSRINALRRFTFENGDRSLAIFQKALAYAKQDKWCLSSDTKLSIDNFLTNNKPVQWAEKSTCASPEASRQERMARQYQIIKEALEASEASKASWSTQKLFK